MKTVEDYLQHATECERLARRAPADQRAPILAMANTWRMLAQQRLDKTRLDQIATDLPE